MEPFNREIISKEHHIIVFDGICNFCNAAVQFLLKRDKKNRFQFAAYQSEFGRDFISRNPTFYPPLSTILYIRNRHIFQKSTAILYILKDLGGIWQFFFIFWIIPAPLRDFLYLLISKNRYRFFGKRKECRIPDAEQKNKFLQ